MSCIIFNSLILREDTVLLLLEAWLLLLEIPLQT